MRRCKDRFWKSESWNKVAPIFPHSSAAAVPQKLYQNILMIHPHVGNYRKLSHIFMKQYDLDFYASVINKYRPRQNMLQFVIIWFLSVPCYSRLVIRDGLLSCEKQHLKINHLSGRLLFFQLFQPNNWGKLRKNSHIWKSSPYLAMSTFLPSFLMEESRLKIKLRYILWEREEC